MVFTERAETAAVSRGTNHATTKQRCNHLDGYSTEAHRKTETDAGQFSKTFRCMN